MSITVELSAESERNLLEQAQTRGLSLEAYVTKLLEWQAAPATPRNAKSYAEYAELVDRVFDTVDIPPGVGEGVLDRENYYK